MRHDQGCTLAVECLPNTCKALGSIPSTPKEKKTIPDQ